MQGRVTRALTTTALLGILLVPAVASFAGPREELRANRNELRSLQERIDSHSSEAGSLKKRIALLNRRITKLQIAINKLAAEIEEVEDEVAIAEAQLARSQKQIDKIKDLATDQAVELYKSGGTEALDALLNSESLAELNDRIEMLGVAAQQNTGALIKYGRLRAIVNEQARALFAKRDELAVKQASHEELNERLSADREQAAEDLATLKRRLGAEKDRERHLESVNEDIKQELLEEQVGTELAELGTSSEGFIWPVNGAVTSPYGSRWGTLHGGIDIDGYTGQPIAAAKSGTAVYVGAGMTGYGNVTMIDHGGGLATLYAHQSAFAVSSGAQVAQGDIIGYVGCTGNCYGDHVHFEVRVGGNPVDPMGYLP